MRALLPTLALVALLAASRPAPSEECCPAAIGGSLNCCAHCGQRCACQMAVCQVERTTKKIKKPCFAVETEEFCVPRPQCPATHDLLGFCHGESCPDASGGPCKERSCGCGVIDWCLEQAHHKCIVPPKCGEVRCRKKLVLKEQECEVPAYTCKVQYLCGACCSATGATVVEPGKATAPAGKEPQAAPPLPPAPLPPATSTSPRQGFLPESLPWRD